MPSSANVKLITSGPGTAGSIKVTTQILFLTSWSSSAANITREPLTNAYPSIVYAVEPSMFENASVSTKSITLIGALPSVPISNNRRPGRNSIIGRLAR